MSEAVADALAAHVVEERTRALRALLMQPLLVSTHPDFPAVRRHAEELRGFFMRETGWMLTVDRDCARLYKRPADLADASRGAREFGRDRYVVLCLACAVLERSDAQITLRALGEGTLGFAADPALDATGFRFTLEHAHERRSLVRVCRLLVELGILERIAGDEESYVVQSGDALYDVNRRRLSVLFAGGRGPSTFAPGEEPKAVEDRLLALTQEYVLQGEQGRRDAMRHMLARRLLDDPAVYFDELDAETREYFANQRGRLAARLAEWVGLEPEQRAEGAALIDPDGELTDAQMPAEGTQAHVTLLVAQCLAGRAQAGSVSEVLLGDIVGFVRQAAQDYGRWWRKDAREAGAEQGLADEALRHLESLKLVARAEGGIRALPALARYAPGTPVIRQGSLLET